MPRRTNGRAEDPRSLTSRSVSRRNVLRSGAASAAVIGGMSLAGCISDGDDAEYQFTIISSPAGFDDNAFNDSARDGLYDAADEWDIDINEVEEQEEGEYEQRQADAAEAGPDLIVMVGDQHTEPLEVNAPEYPDVNWMLINADIGEDNVSGWIEMNHEMSFLAGVGAGTLTQEDIEHEGNSTDPDEYTVGAVGGDDIDLINSFLTSYEEGVEWVADHDDVDIDVRTAYSDSFEDPSGVENLAAAQFDDGADIVWHAAAAAGEGAFQAADDNDRFAIGVDVDQSVTFSEYEDVILGSAIKALDEATYTVSEAVVNDDWGSVSGEQNLSTEEGGIDWITGSQFEGEFDSLDANIEAAKDDIIAGEIDFECGPTGCEGY